RLCADALLVLGS
ncbi:hypothetical protein A2U01_0085174, partial [Trifolium medium]|nr:hypothetical protein [Trifolium medium]